MRARPHLVVDVSGHGFGHLAQVAPVLTALRRRLPDLRLTVRSALPAEVVLGRVPGPAELRPGVPEVGLVMHSGLEVSLDESARAYAALHADWPRQVKWASADLRALRPDLVLADVPYLSLAAAAAAGVPALALCSLNWADIFDHYLGRAMPQADRIAQEIRAAYAQATLFVTPRPHMPMPGLARLRAVGPVGAHGRRRRDELEGALGLTPPERLALVGLGGVDTPLAAHGWPRVDRVRWLVPASWGLTRGDVIPMESAKMPFLDLLASSDLLVTKTGYGSFVEAACAGLPVVYVRRPDWPEEPYLSAWLSAHTRCRAVDARMIREPGWGEVVAETLGQPRSAPVQPSGNAEAAGLLADLLHSAG